MKIVIYLSEVVGATSKKGRGIDYEELRESAGTLCVADLQSEPDRITIFKLESLVSSCLTGSHLEILRTEY